MHLHGAGILFLCLEFSELHWIRCVSVFEFLYLLELFLVVDESLITDCLSLLSILDLVTPCPERLIIRVQRPHVILIEHIGSFVDILNASSFLVVKVLRREYLTCRVAKPAVEGGEVYEKGGSLLPEVKEDFLLTLSGLAVFLHQHGQKLDALLHL